jgi:nuclear pore complex protein Nup133
MPTTGKITYWESVASASTMDLIRQQRNGVELTISGMLSGESVVQILNAEPAGFVLAFSSGRLAYMNVRDGQGRPNISVQFLRGTTAGGGGIFGSLRNALSSSSWRGDLAAARAGPALKPGERDVVTATSKGRLQAWNLHRGGHYSLQAEAEVRESIVQAMKETNPALTSFLLETFEIMDFAFAPTPISGNGLPAGDTGAHLLLLTSLSGRGASYYAVVQVVLQRGTLEIGMVRHIRSYTTPINRTASAKPRLHLPRPALVAFIVFDRAVIVASMARQQDSPESQLLADRYLLTESFEDVVDFRADSGVEITGSGMEEEYQAPMHGIEDSKSKRHKAKFPAAVLLVKGGGIIRVAATDPSKLADPGAPQVTAKSKLEQAVFFGTQENNPLDFSGRAEVQFTAEEVGAAALALSQDVLSSSTQYIPSLPASIDEHLRRRAAALHNLAAHLKDMNVTLDRLTRWKLLWDAEKVAGATVVWNRYDESMREKPLGHKDGLVTEIVEYIAEEEKTEPHAEAGELDRARHWFIHDIARLQIAIPWAYQAVKINYQEGLKNHAMVMRSVSEADDFVSGALEGAFSFREANLGLYGLHNEELENGILKTGYDGLPEFWTSTHLVSETAKKLTDLAFSLAKEYWHTTGGEGIPDAELVNKVRKENVQLVDLCTRSTVERLRWLLAQEDRKIRNQGEHLTIAHIRTQEVQIYRLAEVDLVGPAIKLAEKHKVFPTLVALVVEELHRTDGVLNAMIVNHEDEAAIAELTRRREVLKEQFGDYYKLFGTSFANALYKYYVSRGELFALLHDNDEHQQYLTNFLRSKPEYAKVAWIHEVSREKDFDRAAKTLLDLGLRKERDLWSKKVELSIGKLARLAGKSYSEAGGLLIPDGGLTELEETQKQLSLIDIQDRVFSHIYPAISAAIDEKAEVQLALEVYGNKSLVGKEAFSRLLEENMDRLVTHQALDALSLIDLLTLMGENTKPEEPGAIDGEEFYLALQALKSSTLDKEERSLTERVIWRRCMLRDDWSAINNTDLKDDQQVSDQLRRTALYATLRACIKNRGLISSFYESFR